MLKRVMGKCSLIAVACALSISAHAVAETPSNLDVPAGELVAALKEIARQSDVELLFAPEQLKNLRTEGLRGSYSPQEAIELLLKGTKLKVHALSSGAMVITDKGSGKGVSGMLPTGSKIRVAEATETSAAAESEGNRREELSEVVVTAQKREQHAFDVPISIVAVSDDELKGRRVSSLDDLSLVVPGLGIQSSGSFQRRITLRGVSNIFGNYSSLIGMYLDEASVTVAPSYQIDLKTYDLERVEVLRGPQGTLYGEGSVGGTIRFITKDPKLDRFSWAADATAQTTEGGDPGARIESMLNVPLIEDKLGIRIASTYDRQGGWVDQPAANRSDFNDQDLVNVRVKGLWKPSSQFSVNAMAVIHRNDAAPNAGEDENGDYTQVLNLTTTPKTEDDYELYNLTLAYDFPGIRILSTSSYLEQDKEVRNLGFRYQLTPPEVPFPKFHFYIPLRVLGNDIFSEELRMTSADTGRWNWTVGAYYRHAQFDTSTSGIFALPPAPGDPLPNPRPSADNLRSESWAVFGDSSFELTDRLTLGTGLRYFEDEQRNINSTAPSLVRTGTFNSVNPRFYAQYRLTQQVNIYASAGKGFRSGGFNSGAFNIQNRPTFDPEKVWTYDLGAKMNVLGGRLGADLSLYYSDYSDYQITGFDPSDIQAPSVTSNAGSAVIKGVEWAFTWRPSERWMLGFNGQYAHSAFTEINLTGTRYQNGDPLDLFPKYGYTLSAQHELSWFGKPTAIRMDYNKQGRMSYRDRSFGSWYFDKSDVIDMLNLNVTMQWSQHLSLSVFGQNLLDDRGFTDPFAIEENASRSRPRTYGIGFGVTF